MDDQEVTPEVEAAEPTDPTTRALEQLVERMDELVDKQQEAGIIGPKLASLTKGVVGVIVAALTVGLLIVPIIGSMASLPGHSCPAPIVVQSDDGE